MKRYSKFGYLVLLYAVSMVFFSLFRIANAVAYTGNVGPTTHPDLYPQAFVNGLRFDTLICCYILALPVLLVAIGEIAHISRRWYYAIAHHFSMVGFIVSFFACAANIPYFSYFLRPINSTVLEWDDSFGTVLSMIFTEPTYVFYLVVFIVVAVGYWLLMRWIYRRMVVRHLADHAPIVVAIVLTLAMAFGLFCGMRGRLNHKSPIRIGTAYFCNDSYLNQLGLNPVFTFIKSLEDNSKNRKPLNLVDEAVADEVWDSRNTPPLLHSSLDCRTCHPTRRHQRGAGADGEHVGRQDGIEHPLYLAHPQPR